METQNHTPEQLQSAIDEAYTLADRNAHDLIRLKLEKYASPELVAERKEMRRQDHLAAIKYGCDDEG